jgi:tRNA A37 threonylcarbamoyladenosine modification protein TsaB
MKQVVLIFEPNESYIGLWIAATDAWHTMPVIKGQQTTNAVLEAINTLLSQHAQSLKTVTHIGAMQGPASYTHLRLFITTANTLAWAQHLPLFGFGQKDIPSTIPNLLPQAKRNSPLEPIYPTIID